MRKPLPYRTKYDFHNVKMIHNFLPKLFLGDVGFNGRRGERGDFGVQGETGPDGLEGKASKTNQFFNRKIKTRPTKYLGLAGCNKPSDTRRIAQL